MSDLDRLKEKLEAAQTDQKPVFKKGSTEAQDVNTGLRAGSELVVSIVASAALGYGLDKWLGTRPWCMIGLTFLGVCAGFMAVYRITNNAGDAVGFSALQKRAEGSTKRPENLDSDIDNDDSP